MNRQKDMSKMEETNIGRHYSMNQSRFLVSGELRCWLPFPGCMHSEGTWKTAERAVSAAKAYLCTIQYNKDHVFWANVRRAYCSL